MLAKEREEKMTMDHFAEALADRLRARFSGNEQISVDVNEVRKNNGVILHGITIRDSSMTVAPTFYAEHFWQEYLSEDDEKKCAEEILKLYKESIKNVQDCPSDFLQDFEQVADRIFPKLINAERNKDLLREAPHAEIGDLAVVFQIHVDDMVNLGTVGTVTITNQIAGNWNKSADSLLKVALKNLHDEKKTRICSMLSVLREFMIGSMEDGNVVEDMPPMFQDEESSPLFVMTNKEKINGAIGLVESDILAEFADRMASDLYILPSSVHELILLPRKKADGKVNDLAAMVREVNATQVSREDFLSDNVYAFTRKDKSVFNALTGERLELKVS